MIAIIESDAFAVAMLAVIFCAFGVLGLLLLSMRRHIARRDAQVDQLLEELANAKHQQVKSHSAAALSKPWEKEADWWKNDDPPMPPIP